MTLAILAAVAGCGMASNTLLQPALPDLQQTFRDQDAAAFVPGATLLGYMLGLMLFAPLSDGRDIRKLIIAQGAGLSVALAVEAVAPSPPVLAAAAFVGGAMATISAHTMALAARLTPHRRGRSIGIVAMGISLGLLLGRVTGGIVTQHWGWRAAPALAAGLIFLLSLIVRWRVPPSIGAGQPVSPVQALQRLVPTLSMTSGLRRSAAIGGCWFAAFSALWAALSIHLAAPPFRLGAEAAGAFGLLGVGGALAAQIGGRAADRIGAGSATKSGLGIAFAGFAVLSTFPSDLAAMIVGTLLVDMGCFVAQAANQVRVLGLSSEQQGQVYGVYMTTYYGAGAVGGAAGPLLLQGANWPTLCLICGGVIATAFIFSPSRQAAAGAEA